MYDISGVPMSEVVAKIKADYEHLVSLQVEVRSHTYSIADFHVLM